MFPLYRIQGMEVPYLIDVDTPRGHYRWLSLDFMFTDSVSIRFHGKNDTAHFGGASVLEEQFYIYEERDGVTWSLAPGIEACAGLGVAPGQIFLAYIEWQGGKVSGPMDPLEYEGHYVWEIIRKVPMEPKEEYEAWRAVKLEFNRIHYIMNRQW